MTGAARLRAALETIGWSQRQLAAPLGCAKRLPSAWATGDEIPPESVLRWLELLAALHEAHPPPTDWRRIGRVRNVTS